MCRIEFKIYSTTLIVIMMTAFGLPKIPQFRRPAVASGRLYQAIAQSRLSSQGLTFYKRKRTSHRPSAPATLTSTCSPGLRSGLSHGKRSVVREDAAFLSATAFTMEQTFCTDRRVAFSIIPIIPQTQDRAETHRIIYEQFCLDVVKAGSQAAYVVIAQRLVDRGVDCLILGCTKVGMLFNQSNVSVPVFDTNLAHCDAALAMALER
jgi:hypothetical protein